MVKITKEMLLLYRLAVEDDCGDQDPPLPSPQQWIKDKLRLSLSWIEYRRQVKAWKDDNDVRYFILGDGNSFYNYMEHMYVALN